MPRITRLRILGVILSVSLIAILALLVKTSFCRVYVPDENHVPLSYYLPSTPTLGSTETTKRINAVLFMLARNTDIQGAVDSIRHLEDRWNHVYHYPWVLLNDEDFTDHFKQRVQAMSSSKIHFGRIPRDHWVQPSWINETLAKEGRERLRKQAIPYAGSVSYRNMCRFYSGFFYNHPLIQKYDWYWRVEPGVDYTCDIKYDPFEFMVTHRKVYGWSITLTEYGQTILTLWNTTQRFMAAHPEYVASNNALEMMLGLDGRDNSFNGCHFWSNFEIASLAFFRSPAYTTYFDYLERTGGFYYERWGDAPVHSLAAALMLSRDQIHFFEDIGYEHPPMNHCPPMHKGWAANRCQCGTENTWDYSSGDQCRWRWDIMVG